MRSVCWSGLLLLSLAGCVSSRSSEIDDLISASTRAYAVLEPGLRKDAEAYLEGLRPRGSEYKGQVSIEAYETYSETVTFENQGGTSSEVVDRKTYTIRAQEVVVQYRLREIPSIILRASSASPFEGRVECDVTVLSKVGLAKVTTIPPLPEGYREVTNSGGGRYSGRAPIWHARISNEPLPVPTPPFGLASDLPEAVKKEAEAARTECLKSPETQETSHFTLTFVYSAAERRWKLSGAPTKR
jgi:hypothetical protein